MKIPRAGLRHFVLNDITLEKIEDILKKHNVKDWDNISGEIMEVFYEAKVKCVELIDEETASFLRKK